MQKKRKIAIAKTGLQMKKLRSSDEAVVGIVVTVLLIGLILAVMVMINTVYVPQWTEGSEAAHMEEVSNQFTQLKYALDIQSIVNDSTSITTSVTLGSREIPFFNSGRTFGSLEIVEDSFNITIDRWDNATGKNITCSSNLTDSIKYSSGNSYFVNQQYIYEAGALILSQGESNVLYGKPSLSVTGKNNSFGYGNTSIIRFTLVNISGVSGKTFVSGYGTYPIYTELKDVHPSYDEYYDISNVTYINITTKYTNAWNKTIYSVFLHHLDETHYSLTEYVNGRIEIKFNDPSKDYYNLRIKVVDISAQISSGIAE